MTPMGRIESSRQQISGFFVTIREIRGFELFSVNLLVCTRKELAVTGFGQQLTLCFEPIGVRIARQRKSASSL
jgi:hypothetical protein